MSTSSQNNNKKKIFLASSSSLQEERDEFRKHIDLINKQWESAGISFELVIWEYLLGTVSDTRKQDDYNRAVKDCDIFVLLFFDKVGEYTLEEFNIAYNQFKLTGKPRILIYFKTAAIDTKDITREIVSLLDFKEKINAIGHFWLEYKNVHHLILSFYLQLNEMANDGYFGNHGLNRLDTSVVLPKEITLNMPRIDPDEIIGRRSDLDRLHQLLATQKRAVLVNGMRGIGKTTLARAYLKKYYDEYHHICWITQLSENIAKDFVNTPGLIANLAVETANLAPADLFNAIIGKLKSISARPNLLIIDNAEDSLAGYLDILPNQPSWHLLVTSRAEIMGLVRHQLDFLNEKQAIALFKKHYPYRKLGEEDIKTLVAMVDRHTLAVEVLARTATAHRYDLPTLKQAFDTDIKSNIKVQHGTVEKIGAYLRSVFNLSKLNEEEIWVMKQFTCLPSEYHSSDLLFELIIDEEGIHASTFFETLNGLSQKGWLLHDTEADTYKMHRIIAEVVKQEQPTLVEDVENLVDAIAGKLSLDDSKENPVDKFQWIPFGKTVLAALPGETEGSSKLENNLALRLQDLGDYAGAKALLEKALQSDERNFGADDPRTAISYSNLAVVFINLGDYAGAKALLEKTIQSAERNFGADHPTTAKRYSNLAVVLKNLGDYAGAKALLEKALQSNELNFGATHPTTATSYSNLAVVLQNLGDYAGAKTLLEKAVQSDELNLGVDHPTTAIKYSNLALVLQDLGDYAGAKALLEKASQSNELNFGVDHPATAIGYSNLALVLRDLGDYAGAKALLEKAVQSDERNFGTHHPTTAIRYSNLALVLQNLGDYARAKALLEKALQSSERNFGTHHPTTAIRYSNLALLLQDLGDYAGALELLAKTLGILKKTLPDGHPYIQRAFNNYEAIKNAYEQSMNTDTTDQP